jgi:hypothetical protein
LALQSYLLAAARLAREEGVPMWRPLLYEFPNDPATYNIDDEFFLGDDILVAPILTESGERSVYLPNGEWVNAWTKEKLTGPKTFAVRPGLAEIPVFVRKEHAADFEKLFPPLPTDQRGKVFVELAGATNERGIVFTQRLIRGQKYEKVFLTIRNRSQAGIPVDVGLRSTDGLEMLPREVQQVDVPPEGEARIAFYVGFIDKLEVGTHLMSVDARIWHNEVVIEGKKETTFERIPGPTLTLVKPPQWQVLGPFDGGVGVKFARELPADLAKEYMGAGGRHVRWRMVGDDCVRNDGYVDFEKALGKDNNGSTTFGAATFQATQAGKARFYVGSGDALTIWMNGQLVFDKQVHRGAEPDEDAVDVDLREGENSVLVKISRGIGPNGLYFRVAAGSS